MNLIACPVCGEFITAIPDQPCPECGAILPANAEVHEEPSAVPTKDERPAELQPNSEALTDDLLIAFRSQFELHEVRLPQEWIERLRRLAMETEISRRQATIFFVDLRGYTRLSLELSEEQLDRLRQWFYEVCTRKVELHGGFIIQFLGDAALAAFGAPWAFERDAESALLALLDIREEVRRRGSIAGRELMIRAGADTGIVNVRLTDEHGRKRPDVFGSSVNLAARLEEQAQSNEIWISDTLAAQVEGIFDLEERPAFEPKNYSRELTPFAVMRHKGSSAQRRPEMVNFIGRERELAVMEQAISRVNIGEFAAIGLVGEPGIGKSRLLAELHSRTQSPAIQWIRVDCEPHDRHILLGCMIKVLRIVAHWASGYHIPLNSSPEACFSALAGRFSLIEPFVLPSVGYVLGIEPHVSAVRSVPVGQLRDQVVAGLAALLHAACRVARPWVVAIDDIQWCDPLSREVITRLLEKPAPGMLLIISGRSLDESAPGADNPFGFVTSSSAPFVPWQTIRLDTFAEEDSLELLREVLEIDKLNPLVWRRLISESQGNPLYMIEMARGLSEQEAEWLERLNAVDQNKDILGMSSIVLDILQARIDKLARQRRALLQLGAILGRRFDLKTVQVFEEMHSNLLSELYALKGLRLLREEPLPDDIAFYFTPTLLRDVAYGMLTPEQKVGLHRTVATEIEKRFPDNTKAFSYELAFHWLRAGEPDRARLYLRRAAQRALDHGMAHEAYELTRLALEAFDSDSLNDAIPMTASRILSLQQQGLMEELAGRANRMIGDFARSDDHFRTFARVANLISHRVWIATSHLERAVNCIETGRMEEGEELLTNGIENAGENALLRRRFANARGIVNMRTGRLEEALEFFDAIVQQPAETERMMKTQGDAWNNAGLVRWHLGDLEASQRAFDAALETWQKCNNLCEQCSTLSNMGIIAEKRGSWDEASNLYTRAIRVAEQIGYLNGISAIESNRANLSLLRQHWVKAQEQSARAIHAAQLVGHRESEAIGLQNLGLALGGLGQIDIALKFLHEAEQLGIKLNNPNRRDSVRLAGASVALFNGRTDLAMDFLNAITGEMAPQYRSWRDTITLALQTLEGSTDAASNIVASLDSVLQEFPVEDYLRRIDAVILLCDLKVINEPRDAYIRRREECFQHDGASLQ